ncbi:MAG TPA: ABC transporter ATP-binding protein [Gammaproteobacteria bacterium]|nr:MAG: ABC transporter ATP-binding protein [Gammaproteobacteria bacterium TMED163]HAO89413.1 ABC transporter ATP-binding protein [Gammaproteobacteria bacterium]HAR89333.1 ABC transporter ATP-binding protein [Gammaproteobacteria bacterium]HAU24049.1 ABC transporter ATP-binding protein [Gammaproteobacteria bacterium]|tara:strand:+ start:152 stop:916 length:765 start_codon:yes stop_codon:yes gene_type:complete
MPIIEVTDLQKQYPLPENKSEKFYAVNGVSLAIAQGEIFGILGPNGAGKTTTLEMLEGLNDIDGGVATIDGISVNENPYKVKQVIGVQLQANEYFDNINLEELLSLFAALYNSTIDPMTLLAKVQLEEKARAKPASLSGGQKQRFSIACALVNDPKVLFLDEPTTGLDPQAKRNLWELVQDLNASGMAIVLTTHNMEEAEQLCNRIAIMDHGKIIAEGTPQELILEHAPEPPEAPLHGDLEDVFLVLTGHGLRE